MMDSLETEAHDIPWTPCCGRRWWDEYILYILLVAVIFGLVALVDFVFGKLFPKSDLEPARPGGPAARYSFILGLLMAVFGLVVILLLSPKRQLYLWLGALIVMVMGAFLLVNFFSFAIWYDETRLLLSDPDEEKADLPLCRYHRPAVLSGPERREYPALCRRPGSGALHRHAGPKTLPGDSLPRLVHRPGRGPRHSPNQSGLPVLFPGTGRIKTPEWGFFDFSTACIAAPVGAHCICALPSRRNHRSPEHKTPGPGGHAGRPLRAFLVGADAHIGPPAPEYRALERPLRA